MWFHYTRFIDSAPHLAAEKEMMKLMSDPAAMQKWMDEKRKEFDMLPEVK